MAKTKPIICTLNAVERARRGITWRDVVHRFATAIDEVADGYAISLRAGSASLNDIRALVEAERACCAWMNLELQSGPAPRLTITAKSQEGKAAIREIFGRISQPNAACARRHDPSFANCRR